MQKTMKKKGLIGIMSLALVAVLAIGGSLAFLTDTDTKTNVFAVGDLDITLEEPNWDPDKGTELQPGDTTTKDPVIEAVDNDSYMRVVVSIIDKTDGVTAGTLVTDADRLALIYKTIYFDNTYVGTTTPPTGAIDTTQKYSIAQLAAITSVNNDVNLTEFTKDGGRSTDGQTYYNFNTIFAEGTKATLFTNIVIPTDFTSEDMRKLGKYDIEIKAQAIQSTGFADSNEAFTALDAELLP